jgi:hypothetical protein
VALPVQVGRVQPPLGLQPFEVLQRPPNALDQRRARRRPQVTLQDRVVEVISDRNLPFAERDQLRRPAPPLPARPSRTISLGFR